MHDIKHNSRYISKNTTLRNQIKYEIILPPSD